MHIISKYHLTMMTMIISMTSNDIDDQERDMHEVQCSVSPAVLAGLDKGILLACDSTVSSTSIAHSSTGLHLVLLHALDMLSVHS